MTSQGTQRTRIGLKFEDWPLQDVSAWKVARLKGGPFKRPGPFANWSHGTVQLHQQMYGHWLAFLMRHRPELLDLSPPDRVTLDTVEAYLRDAESRVTNRIEPGTMLRLGERPLKVRTLAGFLFSLWLVIKGFCPARDWRWLKDGADAFMAEAALEPLKPPIPVTAQQLYSWALERLTELRDRDDLDQLEQATAFRQALMVGILIAVPVRARAFISMTVTLHVEPTEASYWLRFRAEDMKDKKARSFHLPRSIAWALERYLHVFRPILLQGNLSDALWITRRGNAMSIDSFTSGLAKLTKREFGITLRPHAFRHIASTTIAECDPEHVNIIRDVLGHATLAMAEKHYNRATAQKACADYQAIIRDTIKDAKARDRKAKRSRKTRRKKHNPQEE
ncbi:tyrosine-type recombinase/integrase [Sinirhodobacter sp. WL0062]|uniref:Tyrosine-type recombinase/integrase n=1 Tax=Rhodobacter flavimaris TaxID=2907145 RepID=A0ABS8Z1R9_9RHOB|nr:site-specific integrase [Sinirhodobacter sp. WL0062]MCE5974897.1 tyrosine-type recombinase/integrase [Sinirhodobacter sp. WL0062]